MYGEILRIKYRVEVSVWGIDFEIGSATRNYFSNTQLHWHRFVLWDARLFSFLVSREYDVGVANC